jgi:DNA invertase Pin-like site-specific DNA recombinase
MQPQTSSFPSGVGGRYHRVSTTKQETERQIEEIDRWLARGGITAQFVFEDHAPRDKAEERPQFQQMMSMVKARKLNWVVIQSIDRLGFKHTYEYFEFLSIFSKNDVQLWSAIEGVCISNIQDDRVILNAVAGLTSSREQLEKGNRSQTERIRRAAKGQYLGGAFPPYGMDVVCYGSDDREKWRYVLLEGQAKMVGRRPNGHPQYKAEVKALKVTPSDSQGEPCSGIPAHDRGDFMALAPSIMQDRIETVRRIFMLLDNEATNPAQIAKLLNTEGVSPVVGGMWSDAKIRPLVQNPCYIGRPATNKKGKPRFYEIQEGRIVRVETQAKMKRRDRKDWVMPDQPLFPPIVDPERFDRVNRKQAPTEKRAPKSDLLYLSGLLYCGHCGQMMVGQTAKRRSKTTGEVTRIVCHYLCGTRNKVGADNPTGCGFHSTQGKDIEPFISEFLAERGQTLADLMGGEHDQAALDAILRQLGKTDSQARELLQEVGSFITEWHWKAEIERVMPIIEKYLHDKGIDKSRVGDADGDEEYDPSSVPMDTILAEPFLAFYEMIRNQEADRISSQIAELEAEHDRLMEKILRVTAPKMVEKLNAQALELEERIEALKLHLEPLKQQWDGLMDEMRDLRRRLAEAEEVMASGSNRAKAQALRGCIERIECRYERGRRAVLKSVTIVPQVGEPHTFLANAEQVLYNAGSRRRG